jgi:predicted aspartyl protease
MKFRLLGTFLFIASACTLVLAQQIQPTENGELANVQPCRPDGQLRTSTPHIESMAKQPFALAFDLYNDHWILVKGTIGSIGNVNILLDTGKSPTAISKKLAEQFNLGGSREWLLMSNGKIEVESVTLPHLQIGELCVESLRVVVQDLSSLGQKLGTTIDAIAGLDVLSSTSLMIDYSKRKIVFGRVKLGRKSVPFETQKPFLTVKANIEGQELRLLVDSGTRGLLVYHNRLRAKLEPLLTNQDVRISTAAGVMPTKWFRASEVHLGKEKLGPKIMLVADVEPDRRYEFDGLFGFTQTGFRRVWLDFENGFFGWE